MYFVNEHIATKIDVIFENKVGDYKFKVSKEKKVVHVNTKFFSY